MTCPSCGAAFHAFYKVSKVVDQMLAGMIAVEDAGGAKARLLLTHWLRHTSTSGEMGPLA